MDEIRTWRFRKDLPDTAEMSERIVRELQKILRTMKSTKREARFLDENRKRKNAEDNAGTS
ncbi:hypothetical protein Tcan_06976 [Toxocara canis]|uniref:Uncharacterized protein n=1 Tax=Toxocara canis TaxID=6265 RepID=A0A0B2W5A1_TOXCA|nr:hypothetical protein Tcan_06976 [Toxocara canis]